MRTLIATTLAILAAGFVTLYVSNNVAANLVAGSRFDTPGAASAVHGVVFLAASLLGLLGGWGAGWLIGYPFRRRQQ